MRKPKIDNDEIINLVAERIHWYISYATLSTYHAMHKSLDINVDDVTREKSIELLEKILTTAESTYSDLSDRQKELTRGLALKLIGEIVSKLA